MTKKSTENKVIVAGVGMILLLSLELQRPMILWVQKHGLALRDSGVDYKNIQSAFVGYVFGDSTSGQRALYHVGMTGIPIINVNNNCSTGSTALYLARQAIESGSSDCVLGSGL